MYYRQPKYYGAFQCSGTDCCANCCYGWYIDWSKEDVDKIKNSPKYSSPLKELVESAFVLKDEKSKNQYMIKFNDNGKCPFQTEEGLCRIQKELGAEYLSHTCTIYPRYNTFTNTDDINEDVIYRGCYLSCQEVVRSLISDEKSTDLINVPTKENSFGKVIVHFDSAEDILAYPELKYRCDMFEFFYELIGDKKRSAEASIILGALAAQKFTQIVDKKQYELIPEALKAFRRQVHNASALKSIENINPNYNVKFGVADRIMENALDFRMTDVLKDENGELDIRRYLAGEAKLNEMMKDKPFWLRNIALNLILELCIPFKSKKHTIFDNYSFFTAAISCVKLNAVAAAFAPEKLNIQTRGTTLHLEGLNKIYGLTGVISRRIFQTYMSFENVTKILNEFDMDSPAYLALLIK